MTRRTNRIAVVTLATVVLLVGGGGQRAGAAVANDNFGAAALLPTGSGTANGSTVGATKQAGEPAHGGDAGGHSIWWKWKPTASGHTTIDTCGSSFDTLLGVYTGSAVNALTTVASDDDGRLCGLTSVQSSVYFDAVAGRTYLVAVDGYGGAAGAVKLRVIAPGAVGGDNFAHAVTVPASGGPMNSSTLDATKEPGEPNHAGNAGGHSIWFKWTPSTTATALVHTCGSDFNTLLGVYTGSAVNSLTTVVSNDDSPLCGDGARQSAASFRAVSGTTYDIAVDGFDGDRGAVQLQVTKYPGDDFADAQPIAAAGGSSSRATYVATKEPNEPDHAGNAGGHSIWWKWTPATSATVVIQSCGSDFNTLLGVYTGSAVGNLTPVASNDDTSLCGSGARQSAVTFDGVGGTPYAIAVDGFNGARGAVQLHVSGPAVSPPGAPALTSAMAGDGWLNVGWSAPASDGGDPVFRYVVTLSTGEAAEVTADQHAATLLVSNDVARTAHVTAVNSAGAGPPSPESSGLTPTHAPIDVTTTYDDDGSTRLVKNATYFGQSASVAQRTSVGILAFLVGGIGGAATPVADPGAAGAHSYTTTWSVEDQPVLITVMRQFCLTPSDAQQFSVRLVGFLLALQVGG